MIRTDSILLVTDLSAAGVPAMRRAALIAAEHDARLTLLTVVDPTRSPSRKSGLGRTAAVELRLAHARECLHGRAMQLGALCDVEVQAVVRSGDVLQHIAAAAEKADLVVLGARRDNVLREFLFGTPAERVVRISRRPVLVVKQAPVSAYRRVLVPVDFSESSALAVQLANGVAPTAEVHLFHALESMPTAQMRTAGVSDEVIRFNRELARARRMQALRTLGGAVVGIQAAVGEGPAPALTLARQEALAADLVVVGKHNRSRWADFLLGSVTQRLLAAATSDVLVLPKAVRHRRPSRRPLRGLALGS